MTSATRADSRTSGAWSRAAAGSLGPLSGQGLGQWSGQEPARNRARQRRPIRNLPSSLSLFLSLSLSRSPPMSLHTHIHMYIYTHIYACQQALLASPRLHAGQGASYSDEQHSERIPTGKICIGESCPRDRPICAPPFLSCSFSLLVPIYIYI